MLRNFSFLCWVDVFTCSVSAHKFCRLSWCLLTPIRNMPFLALCIPCQQAPEGLQYQAFSCLWQGAEILWESLLCELWTSRPNRFFRHILWASAHATSLLRGIVSGWGKHHMAGGQKQKIKKTLWASQLRRIRKYGGNWRATFLFMVGVLTWLQFYVAWTKTYHEIWLKAL